MVRLSEITLGIEAFIDQFVRRKLPTIVVCDRLHPLLIGDQKPHDFRCYVGGILPFYLAYKRVLARTFDQEYPVVKFLLDVANHLLGHLDASQCLTTLLHLSMGLLGPVSPQTTVPANLPVNRGGNPAQENGNPAKGNILLQQRINWVTFSFGELAVQHSHRALLE